MRYILIGLLALFISSCSNSKIKKSEVEYDNDTKTILYKGKPFTGTVVGEGKEANRSAIVKDGKLQSETWVYQNEYKKVENSDGTEEYYDYNEKRITKEEFMKNN